LVRGLDDHGSADAIWKPLTGLSCRGGKGAVGKANCGTLEYFSRFIDDQPKSTMIGKEGQSMPSLVFIDPTLTAAGNVTLPHARLKGQSVDPEALSDQISIDLNSALTKIDHPHEYTSLWALPGPSELCGKYSTKLKRRATTA
jgi:hypothetical protein